MKKSQTYLSINIPAHMASPPNRPRHFPSLFFRQFHFYFYLCVCTDLSMDDHYQSWSLYRHKTALWFSKLLSIQSPSFKYLEYGIFLLWAHSSSCYPIACVSWILFCFFFQVLYVKYINWLRAEHTNWWRKIHIILN